MVLFAIAAGVTCASLVVFVFATGFQVPHAWYALVVTAIGASIALALRATMPKTDPEEDAP